MTWSQVSVMGVIENWSSISSLYGRPRSILQFRDRYVYICGWSTDTEVVSSQIILFWLIKFGFDMLCIAFAVEVYLLFWEIVPVHLGGTLWSCPDIKVARLDLGSKVFIDRLHWLIRVAVRVCSLIWRHEAKFISFSKLDRGLFSHEIANFLFSSAPTSSAQSGSRIYTIILIYWPGGSHREVCRLILCNWFELALASTGATGASQLFKACLWVV